MCLLPITKSACARRGPQRVSACPVALGGTQRDTVECSPPHVEDSSRHLKEGRRMQWACRMHCGPKSHKIGQGVPYVLISERPGHTMGFTAPGKVGASCGYTVVHGDISITQTNRKLKSVSDGATVRLGAGPPVHGTSSRKTKGPCLYKRQGE